MALDDPETGGPASAPAITPLRLGLAAVAVLAAAFLAYWFGLRTAYDPVLRGLPPEDAADVVKVLDAKKIPYRLAHGGTTILVPGDQADKARIELVGSELPMRGQVGFELFNQSDMGLTEFAQKINYQRAMQGELARTILMLDGIQSVRVHLGMAERSLFRDEQAAPKASVALVLKPGTALTESRVGGIQRLVAGAVPDLTPEAVAVLDETGKVVSPVGAAEAPPLTSSEARLQLYRANVLAALQRAYPDRRFGITVSLQVSGAPARGGGEEKPAAPDAGKPAEDAVRVLVTTPAALDGAVQDKVMQAIGGSIGAGAQLADVAFTVGDAIAPASLPAAPPPAPDKVVAQSTRGATGAIEGGAPSAWWLALPLALGALALAIWSDRRRRERGRVGLQSFTRQLRERLAAMPEAAA